MSTTATATSIDPSARMEELGRIILAYSEVTEKLQQSHDRLQQQVVKLRDELSEKNRLLERRNRLAALGEMAAGMAHEIRNPLGGIQLYASMLAKDVEDRPASQELVRKISGGVKRLEKLVSQVLQFSREMTPTFESADLAEIVQQSVEFASAKASDRNVRCYVNGPDRLPVTVDAMLIGQALLNLLLNAIDAARQDGSVWLDFGTAEQAPQFHLVVRDNGSGIDPQVMDKIFNPFFTTKDTGTGLGLAIVHRIVEAHDGTIIAGNCPERGGARFEIRI